MKRKLQILAAMISCLSIADHGYAQITFERSYGGQFYDTGSDVIETPDHNYLVFGTTRSVSNDTTDAYLLKLDENGDSLWTKIYGGKLEDSGIAITSASDGGYVLGIASGREPMGVPDLIGADLFCRQRMVDISWPGTHIHLMIQMGMLT
jgi:hypothetical protein